MHFSVDLDSRTLIYLQIKDQIRYAITVGELRPGDVLPSIRELEAELGVNRNTIRRAYLELQNEGTLTIRQGKKAEVATNPLHPRGRASVSQAEMLAHRMVQEVEAEGFDSVWFSSVFRKTAVDHDRRHAKCAFIECSQYQADDFASTTGAVWGRRVVGIDLHRLREDIDLLPSSTQYVLTTHWHLSEVQQLLKHEVKAIQEVRVQLSQTFYEDIRRLHGLMTGLILRDPESVSGYRKLVRELAEVRGNVPVALMDEQEAQTLMDTVEGVVYTTPCRSYIAKNAPSDIVTQELLYQPVADDLVRIGEEFFPV